MTGSIAEMEYSPCLSSYASPNIYPHSPRKPKEEKNRERDREREKDRDKQNKNDEKSTKPTGRHRAPSVKSPSKSSSTTSGENKRHSRTVSTSASASSSSRSIPSHDIPLPTLQLHGQKSSSSSDRPTAHIAGHSQASTALAATAVASTNNHNANSNSSSNPSHNSRKNSNALLDFQSLDTSSSISPSTTNSATRISNRSTGIRSSTKSSTSTGGTQQQSQSVSSSSSNGFASSPSSSGTNSQDSTATATPTDVSTGVFTSSSTNNSLNLNPSSSLAGRRERASSKRPPAPIHLHDNLGNHHSSRSTLHKRDPNDHRLLNLPRSPLAALAKTALTSSRRSSLISPTTSPDYPPVQAASLLPPTPPSSATATATAIPASLGTVSKKAGTGTGAGSFFFLHSGSRHDRHESHSGHRFRSSTTGTDAHSPSPSRGLSSGSIPQASGAVPGHSHHKSYPLPTPPNDKSLGGHTRSSHSKQLPPIPLQILKTQNAAMVDFGPIPLAAATLPFQPIYRTESASTASGTTYSSRTGVMTSSENLAHSSAGESTAASNTSTSTKPASTVAPKPLVVRNGRTYIGDATIPYMLPVDLAELHRQTLRTLLNFQLFGGPIISDAFTKKPPVRVLEVGCGSGFWSMMCHRYFAGRGHTDISFTGLDIVPLCGTNLDPNSKPDKDMRWRFIQHDMRRTPWPLQDGEFDLVMVKDMALAAPGSLYPLFFDEYLRVLKPGGTLELWETDLSLRMLRPHSSSATKTSTPRPEGEATENTLDDEETMLKLGAYVMTANTPLSAPLNQFLVEYNGWLTKALEQRALSPVPCTVIGPALLQETSLMDVQSKRLAVPLSEVRWEREGVGGVVTKDGKSYIDSMKGKARSGDAFKGGKTLTRDQAALRRTALETSIGLIVAMEPVLREVTGKSQDEWDVWTNKMMNDLMREGGTSWGECMEVGAWTARKRQ